MCACTSSKSQVPMTNIFHLGDSLASVGCFVIVFMAIPISVQLISSSEKERTRSILKYAPSASSFEVFECTFPLPYTVCKKDVGDLTHFS